MHGYSDKIVLAKIYDAKTQLHRSHALEKLTRCDPVQMLTQM